LLKYVIVNSVATEHVGIAASRPSPPPITYPHAHRPDPKPQTPPQSAVDALLALPVPLDPPAWLDCLDRCAPLIAEAPAALTQRLAALQRLLGGAPEDTAAALSKAPYLLLHESASVEAKVRAGGLRRQLGCDARGWDGVDLVGWRLSGGSRRFLKSSGYICRMVSAAAVCV
jgi:hypothetical protein